MSLNEKPDFVDIHRDAVTSPTEAEAIADTITQQERDFINQISDPAKPPISA